MSAATPGQAAEPEIPVHLVRLWLCELCLNGKGGECHSPGCSLWINRAPDISLRGNPMVTILDAAQEPHAAPGVWTVAECLERIGDLAGALHEIKTAYAPGTYAHDLAHATLDQSGPEPKAAPELAAAMRESRVRAEVITEILDAFGPSGSGHTARVGMVQIAKWRTRAGLTS